MTQVERTELSDHKMLEAATELLLEVGSMGTTLKEVGERAGYSRGLASARFGSKEGLFLRLITVHRESWALVVSQHIGDKTGVAAIMARIDAVEELFRREPETVKAVYMLWFESVGRTSGMRETLLKFHHQTLDAIAVFVQQGIDAGEIPAHVDPRLFAIDYFAQIFGFIYQWLFSPEDVQILRCVDALRILCVDRLTDSPQGVEYYRPQRTNKA
ncbi:MAG: TetR/AcrR family transcriptional regulator [Gammaproteobacteria bacterium]|nr:TetR/AcrR family transcriptional regulator [Gammaproteobacteria bacterium]